MATIKKQEPGAGGLPVQRLIPVTVIFAPEGDDATVTGPIVPLDFSQSLDFSDPTNSDLLPGL